MTIAITEHRTYFDTARVWLPQPLNTPQQRELKRLDPISRYEPIPQHKRFRVVQDGVSILYQVRIILQRMDAEVLALLKEGTSHSLPPLVNAAHLALDLVARDVLQAELIHGFLERHLVKRWHRGLNATQAYLGTRYFGKRKQRKVIAMYSSKPQRHTGEPCCHVEARLQTRSKLKAAGIHSLDDLLSFDHAKFWEDHFQFAEVNLEALGKRLRGKHLNASTQMQEFHGHTRNADRLRGGMFVRMVAYEELGDGVRSRGPAPSIPGLRVALRGRGISHHGVIVPMDVEWIALTSIPSSHTQ